MASEIISDHAPILESDMPESSMGKEPQGIMINQGSISNEFIIQMLQQIFMAQMNAQELAKEDTQLTTLLPAIPNEIVEEFQGHLSADLRLINCDRLCEMVNQFPSQLFLQTFDVNFFRSALHVAILKGSQTLIDAMVEKLKALCGSNDLKLAEHDFILKKDRFGLSAEIMTALIVNKKITSFFPQVFGFKYFILGISIPSSPFCRSPTSEDEKKNLLEKASPLLERQALPLSYQGTGQSSIRQWLLDKDVDIVHCLHEAAVKKYCYENKALEFVKFVCDNGDSSFLEPLLNVRDSLGKSPLHVCYEESSYDDVLDFKPLFEILDAHFPNLDLNMRDFSGRTPLHWAAAQGFVDVVTLLASQERTDLNAEYGHLFRCQTNESTSFNDGWVDDVTALHLAVIHNHVEVVEALLQVPEGRGLNVNASCMRSIETLDANPHNTYILAPDGSPHNKYRLAFTPFQLAAYMGHEQILRVFLKDSRLYDPGLKNGKESDPEHHNMIPALCLAASQFHPLAVKTLVDCRKIDILAKDEDENTALHYAAMSAHGRLQIHAILGDYVTVSHFTSKPPQSRKPSDYDIITCIDILMQSGLEMEQRNKDGITPTLHPSCPENVQTWWLQKMAKEAEEKKNNLITAANAVSVTAALVATASFVGPLQPPLGLFDDGNQTWLDGYSQVQHTSVQVFLFCDSLSFYFAIAAIVFAMLPSWPIPREGLAQEVRIARRCVQVAVLLLFGSIIFVLCAFSAASIAIVPNRLWQYKTIAVISTSLGVLICFLVLFLSFMRLLTLISSRNEFARKISNLATWIMLWEQDTS